MLKGLKKLKTFKKLAIATTMLTGLTSLHAGFPRSFAHPFDYFRASGFQSLLKTHPFMALAPEIKPRPYVLTCEEAERIRPYVEENLRLAKDIHTRLDGSHIHKYALDSRFQKEYLFMPREETSNVLELEFKRGDVVLKTPWYSTLIGYSLKLTDSRLENLEAQLKGFRFKMTDRPHYVRENVETKTHFNPGYVAGSGVSFTMQEETVVTHERVGISFRIKDYPRPEGAPNLCQTDVQELLINSRNLALTVYAPYAFDEWMAKVRYLLSQYFDEKVYGTNLIDTLKAYQLIVKRRGWEDEFSDAEIFEGLINNYFAFEAESKRLGKPIYMGKK